MVDITNKSNTLRIATAQAIVRVSKSDTIEAIKNKTVPKGDVFEMSKAAGLLGVKKTPELLPDCHPIPIEFTGVEYNINGLEIEIKVTVKTIYKTGVEVEAMHGASIVALNMYDMLKPIDKGVEILHIKLLKKQGGKSDFIKDLPELKAKVVVCSDSVSEKKAEDKSGKTIIEKLNQYQITDVDYRIISDDFKTIQEELLSAKNIDLLIFTGGTGVSKRDNTPDAILPLLDKELKGVAEKIRKYGQERMPYAMLSRSVAGIKNDTLVLTFPGSVGGVIESMDAIFPHILHVFKILKGEKHN